MKVLDELKQWKSLEQQPPMTEVEALRYMNKNNWQGHKEGKALLYVTLAYHRIKRHPGEDLLAEQFIDEARVLDPAHPLVAELYESQQLMQAYTMLKNTPLDQWVLHETDHDSAKAKKVKSIYSDVGYLKKQWDKDLAEKTIIDASSRLKLYQDVYEELGDLEIMLEEAIHSIENRRIRVPVKEINERARRLSDNQDEIYKRLPGFLTDQSFQNPLEAFDQMVGLKDVKTYIRRYYHFLRYQQQRKSYGFSMVDEPGLHMIITGNPGTGKTTMARLLANIYHELGILDTKEVIEVNRSHLVGSYVGQSEENTMNYVKQAIGGVLFIDEAYSLKREGQTGNDYGQAVIDTLVSAMTSKEYGGKFAVILAGYPEEMRQFLWSNPGLRSRFPEQNHIELPDYQMDELLTIAEQTAIENDFFFTETALKEFSSLIERERVDDSFGNARTVKNLVLKTIFQKGAQEAERDKQHWLDHMRISSDDLEWEDPKREDQPSPMERLDELIGLANVKTEVRKLSSFVQAQQKRKEKGYPVVPIQLHSVFSGNPGTGKTTVAEIYANVLKQCGLLKRGHTVVVSRSDLVAGYIGQTAIKTKRKIREALGGVLFIDEAYSLYNGGRDDFGKEAIETLVDEMTKHNENLVVILAGYQREMEQLVESNPGLSSRFKKYFHFPDYSESELLQMTHYQAKQYGYHFNEWAESFLLEKFTDHKIRGNGRFINNLVNEAIQFQAIRIMDDEAEDINDLQLEDFEKAWHMVRRES
ncbi:AAA+-type ATPase, SpoVK/Ycf46/Vps4 family [Halobacillus karajensis]|uniref:Stage V sporulation protein K n=2 Tax=Halobacillus karajensis TaxID=195088 RepID=A0A024P203_9BACI|nr:AAA family ATPase [Halobacillus karajensis]CDQ19623.1 Stage V sporulation protein K [Halobacillus karajensis]CDQ22083.1 Stage V sporulation protein K [Halobacillus karajensis]CDQ27924.1 Stage V sporulation protein K [Halobacillus karajensis]SEH79360.1 AAA+-type ATPase, SpoVK/Ycf46/Vps4 family [Halobacillus karajensis]